MAGGAVSFDLDNVSITQLGYTAILDPAIAAGLTAINPSRGTSNDSTDWLFSTTGITAPSSNRTQTIRWTTSAAGNQQLFGAPCIDTTGRWRIRSWTIYTTGTPTVSLGNISAGTAYANGVTLVAGVNDITVATRTPGTANLWCNSSTNASLEHVVLLDRVD
ncbi:hypothetical protein DB354_10185 [Opitutus sp. ER46]|nr:hypothetical protein DB354_10185 [Opitutus sp. ER46]